MTNPKHDHRRVRMWNVADRDHLFPYKIPRALEFYRGASWNSMKLWERVVLVGVREV